MFKTAAEAIAQIEAVPDLIEVAKEYEQTIIWLLNEDYRNGNEAGAAVKRSALARVQSLILKAGGQLSDYERLLKSRARTTALAA